MNSLFDKISFIKILLLQKLSVVRSEKIFNFTEINSIVDALSHWMSPNVKHLVEENLLIEIEQMQCTANIYASIIPSMLE